MSSLCPSRCRQYSSGFVHGAARPFPHTATVERHPDAVSFHAARGQGKELGRIEFCIRRALDRGPQLTALPFPSRRLPLQARSGAGDVLGRLAGTRRVRTAALRTVSGDRDPRTVAESEQGLEHAVGVTRAKDRPLHEAPDKVVELRPGIWLIEGG